MLDFCPEEASSIGPSPFLKRHIGPTSHDQDEMLRELGFSDINDFVRKVVPSDIYDGVFQGEGLIQGCDEVEALGELREIAKKNIFKRSLIGLGYCGTATPSLIKRQILENPAWFTAYTPYQAEMSQGRLEALFNFQTLISELTGLPIANASLLDEATAAAEAMSLGFAQAKGSEKRRFLVDIEVLPQTLAVLRTRSEPLGVQLEVEEPSSFNFEDDVFGIFLQLPGCNGRIWDPSEVISSAHELGAIACIAVDPLAQVLLKPVADFGADVAVGSIQRFGIPMGFGGPHAAFFATSERFKRQVPGRLVGMSVDSEGKPALRLALQTREQHIRREKATSNICTSQVLLAVMSSFYALHHGPEGLTAIAKRISSFRLYLEQALKKYGYNIEPIDRFDTIQVLSDKAPEVHKQAILAGYNLRILPLGSSVEVSNGFGITIDELTTKKELKILLDIFGNCSNKSLQLNEVDSNYRSEELKKSFFRQKSWLQQEVFHLYRSETELLRYMQRLSTRDFSLVHGMIPLGSCTMKLNAASELEPISWPEFASIHPFAPKDQSEGYRHIFSDLEQWLSKLTGFAGVSLQPNAGSQGEFAGLLVIRAWHKFCGQSHRNICLIPKSAHGTNPASSINAGFKVVPVDCDQYGNVDLKDLTSKVELYSSKLAALMITYPSTHGVFEPGIKQICDLIHNHGGQIYLDGANFNAQVGICRPGKYGVDVCHLNLHKTFCIPHGGGGPGVGPIAVSQHLVPFLPGHPLMSSSSEQAIGPVSAAPWGSAGILPISWMYLRMMGVVGLRECTSVALLSANYIAKKLGDYYPILFRGLGGWVAHECILDLRRLKRTVGVEVDDVAKRLIDYGFHAPTVSWPVAGTLMVEPTESESLLEIKRFCEALIAIRKEIIDIENGHIDIHESPLRLAPHTLTAITSSVWDRPYSREKAVFPMPNQVVSKYWPAVSRIDNAYGDRNLVCSCTAMSEIS